MTFIELCKVKVLTTCVRPHGLQQKVCIIIMALLDVFKMLVASLVSKAVKLWGD